jgi:hypothetical protein
MTAQQRAARVQLMLFDIDGVLTDGRLYFDAQGEAQKVFHVHDGHGLKLLREAGIMTGVVSGRQSAPAQARLRELNPRLIYCAISGFGQTGPAAARPAYDTVAQAASAFLKLLVNPANPRVVGPAVADAMTGFYAAYGVLGALVERGRTGQSRKVEVSMLEAMCHFNLDAFTHYFSENEIMGPFSRPSVSQSYVLECADGLWIALHMSSPEKFWQGLANAIERPDLFQDARFATREGRIAPEDMARAITPGTKLVSVSAVSTYNGFQHDLKAISAMAHKVGALVYADIIHAAGAVPVDVKLIDAEGAKSFSW